MIYKFENMVCAWFCVFICSAFAHEGSSNFWFSQG